MKPPFIYVVQSGSLDQSRWLSLSIGEMGWCQLDLQDLCQPGQVSGLKSVQCPIQLLEVALEGGTVQMTNADGYCLIRGHSETLSLEFRSRSEKLPIKVQVRVADVERVRESSVCTQALLAG